MGHRPFRNIDPCPSESTSWWSGKDTPSIRDRFLSFNSFDKIRGMQEELLNAGGKKCHVWFRVYTHGSCTCVEEDGQAKSNHPVCYGTGFIGGYEKYGYDTFVVYRKDSNTLRVVGDGVDETVPILSNQVEFDWIQAKDEYGGDVEYKLEGKRSRATVEFSSNGVDWSGTLTFPVQTGQFKVRITSIDGFLESLRFRVKKVDDVFIRLSENPPRRLEQLLREGLIQEPFDIRAWTISRDFIITSGDIIEWIEGVWTGERYIATTLTQSQFVLDAEQSSFLTQILGMRKIRSVEQLYRVW